MADLRNGSDTGVAPAPRRVFPLVSPKKKDKQEDVAAPAAPTEISHPPGDPEDSAESSHNGVRDHGEHDSAPFQVNSAAMEPVAKEPDLETATATGPEDVEPFEPSPLSTPGAEVPDEEPHLPSIRVISAEAERESKKVRSLYESGQAVDWEGSAGGNTPATDDPVASSAAVVRFQEENDTGSSPPNSSAVITESSTTATSENPLSQQQTLAGGVEDWDGVEGQDVDRYGFISPPRPQSRPGTSDARSIQNSVRKQRKVLSKRDGAAPSLRVKRGPTRKMSTRSLVSQGSDASAVSRISTRSGFRHAMNFLPHNKNRRIIDQAGDMLSNQPGLTNIAEDEAAERLAEELKYKEVERTEKWRKMAHVVKAPQEGQGMTFEFDPKNPKVVERTWKGIPDCWRSAAWYSFLLSSAKASKKPFRSDEEIIQTFHRLLKQPSPDDGQIDMDVPRTINMHIMFRRRYAGGQRLLFRVLHALSLYFPETGYGQGMATLAATLLSYYDEERCFVMLVRLWEYRGLTHLYDPQFSGLLGALGDFGKYWLGTKDVSKTLEDLDIEPTAYATRWYLTLFNLSIPFPAQLRVLDVFMLLGSTPSEELSELDEKKELGDRAISSKGLEILHATSLAIVDAHHDVLMNADFENAMKTLTSRANIKDAEYFMRVVRVEWKQHHARGRAI